MDGRNRTAIYKKHRRVVERSKVLRGLVTELHPADIDAKVAQERARNLSFQNSPHFQYAMNGALLLEHVDSCLSLLEWACGLVTTPGANGSDAHQGRGRKCAQNREDEAIETGGQKIFRCPAVRDPRGDGGCRP